MDCESVFKKYYRRVVFDSLLRSAVWGVAIGGAVGFITAFITWFTVFNGMWLSIGLGLAAFAVSVPLFYFLAYRPTTEHIAQKLDSLGLEERMITMTELRNDESYMAMRQREDALGKLSQVSPSSVGVGVSRASAIAAPVAGLLGIAMIIVTGLSGFGVIPGFADVIDPDERDKEYSVEYIVDDEEMGYLVGEDIQVVLLGEDTAKVTAVANDGYVFDGWDDGVKDATRFEKNVQGNLTFTAIFVELDDSDGDDDGEDGDGEGDSDSSSNSDPSDSDSSNNGSGNSGITDTSGNCIDGETYYRAVYETYYQEAMQYLAENGDIPDYLRDIIESYFNILL